jgi:hypothetical protein
LRWSKSAESKPGKGELRVTFDYSEVKEKVSGYTLVSRAECFDYLNYPQNQIFCQFDLTHAYWSVLIHSLMVVDKPTAERNSRSSSGKVLSLYHCEGNTNSSLHFRDSAVEEIRNTNSIAFTLSFLVCLDSAFHSYIVPCYGLYWTRYQIVALPNIFMHRVLPTSGTHLV